MNDYDFNKLKKAAIAAFKEYYSQYDSRIMRTGEYRFSVHISVRDSSKVIVRLHNFHGVRYGQVYNIKDLI